MAKMLTERDDDQARKELSYILQHRGNVIVIGHLNPLWIKRFESNKMTVIDKNYDLDELKNKMDKGHRGFVLIIEEVSDVSDDYRMLFANTVYYKATRLPSCIEWCAEKYAYLWDPKVMRGSKTNMKDELLCYQCDDYDLFSCIYDPQGASVIDEGIEASYTSCRERCLIEHKDNPNKEQQTRGVCPDGETWYEQYGSTFDEVEYETQIIDGEEFKVPKRSKEATFKGKEIQ